VPPRVVQYLCQEGHLRTPDAVEKVTAWLQPGPEAQEAGLIPSWHVQRAPSANDTPSDNDNEVAAMPRRCNEAELLVRRQWESGEYAII
jgi:hypothetical protein